METTQGWRLLDHNKDSYKVESIGDGYLCVSRLPVKNGHQHIKQIVEMSVRFMDYVEKGVMETYWVHDRHGMLPRRKSIKHESIEQHSPVHTGEPLYRE
ncbi:hypothetical protein ANCCAN_09411 [Ancylostoma caninum]|uniref:Guanylate cyclase domain-containing protein n=1 Tax=Ancylostoma caninum TaxID=29170 RepID=A0A368GJM5_ANCCA|nr:hypothetical protein ANCCAN_09411 [Ancylostoma caninum]